MNKLLTLQETIQALLDDKDVEYSKKSSNEWFKFKKVKPSVNILDDESYKFRLSQEMITINNVSFPKPYYGKIKEFEIYYFPLIGGKTLFSSREWFNTTQDFRTMQRGLVHLTEENAIAHAKALIQLSGGDL